jgi:signal transduction histidine kinase
LPALFYIRLIALTAGTLVYFFLIALILGHRRPRLLERLLFFLVLSIFLIYAGGLLEINARIQYGVPSEATRTLYQTLSALGDAFLPALLLHAFVVYWQGLDQKKIKRWVANSIVGAFYLLPAATAIGTYWIQTRPSYYGPRFSFSRLLITTNSTDNLGLIFATLIGAFISLRVSRISSDMSGRHFFQWMTAVALAIWILLVFLQGAGTLSPVETDGMLTAVLAFGILPGALLMYFALKHNFLEYGAQRNLVYALSATFLALLYLALVHRVSGWLEPALPREATAAILLFLLIFLFEPLERAIGPRLHAAFRERIGEWQRLATELQGEARQGDVARFVTFAEGRIREEFGLAAARISVPGEAAERPLEIPGRLGHSARLPLVKDSREIGSLEGVTTGAYITGETSAGLEFLAEQLPTMLDLCRLIEEKLRLERELADRERLALLGQMAASVSHNLRNPLSSMKTILQVQLENPDLPLDVRHDCALVVGEIDRMGEKLRQLLNFAKPSVNGQSAEAVGLARQTAALFGRDAERRNLRLEFDGPAEEVRVTASEEALSEVLSNLIVNAIEAQPKGGRVRLGIGSEAGSGRLEIRVEDDGPGIVPEIREKIFQPYFTTKASGTGLGLSIVARRVEEMGGTIACESPVRGGRGTRFRLSIPIVK